MVSAYLDQLLPAFIMLCYAYGLLLVTWPVFLLLEKLSPVNSDIRGSHFWFNWKITFSNWLITPAFSALVVAFSLFVAQSIGAPVFAYPAIDIGLGVPAIDLALNALVLLFVSCFLADFWYYWWHRLQHKLPFLWELHKLHHSDEALNTTSIYRSHFLELAGQALIRGLSVGLIFDLSSPPQTMLAILVAGLLPPVWDFFIHANVRYDWLHRLLPYFSTPQYHWIHHSRLPQHQDTNFAIWLPLFDKVFGSYYHPAVDEYPPTGLSSGEKIDTVWEAQVGPLKAWWQMLTGSKAQLTAVGADPASAESSK